MKFIIQLPAEDIIYTTQEFQLFDISVSLHGDWFSPAQDPNFEAMAAWWSGNVNRKTFLYKIHKHLENHYKNGLEKRVKMKM